MNTGFRKSKDLVDVHHITNSLRDLVALTSNYLRSQNTISDLLLQAVISRFDLFRALSNEPDQHKHNLKTQDAKNIFDLAAYLQVNQILFITLYIKSLIYLN